MSAALLALLISMPALLVGPLAGKPWFQPGPGVTRAQLAAQGAGSCALRTGILIAINPQGRIETQSQGGRLCTGNNLLLCPAGWIGSGNSATCRQLPAGWLIVGARDSGVAAAETDATQVPHECRCSSGASCTAQPTLLNGTLGAAVALPLRTIAGADYSWKNPAGAGCVAVACTETSAGIEWPDACPRQ